LSYKDNRSYTQIEEKTNTPKSSRPSKFVAMVCLPMLPAHYQLPGRPLGVNRTACSLPVHIRQIWCAQERAQTPSFNTERIPKQMSSTSNANIMLPVPITRKNALSTLFGTCPSLTTSFLAPSAQQKETFHKNALKSSQQGATRVALLQGQGVCPTSNIFGSVPGFVTAPCAAER